jgi:peptide/nickel transport system substrate-binding protein
MRAPRLRAVVALGVVATLALAGCSESQRNEEAPETLIFGSSADPKVLDPALASDGETFRVTRQIYDTLVQNSLGGAEIEPALATSWSADAAGTAWTFQLREGVKFHDGTDFNAAAVCFNFERWFHFTGELQNQDISYYWQAAFGGFADGATPSLYASCAATGDHTVVINTTRVTSSFIPWLSLPAFSIASPKALQDFNADAISGSGDSVVYPEYAMGHAVGTGPYKFVSWDTVEHTVTIESNPDYWGGAPSIEKIIFKAIGDLTARKQALESGEIQGYDLVAPQDIAGLRSDGYKIITRPAFNILYLAMNQAGNPALADVRVRQAIAHAVNRQAIVNAVYPEGAEVATNFHPPSLPGWNADVTKYDYDVEEAKALLAAAGQSNLTLQFYYPTNVSRPYMPDPEAIFQLISADLEAAGITVEPVALQWSPDYLEAVQASGEHDLHLLGWTGDFGDAYNFIGTFFGRETGEWGFNNAELFNALAAADTETDDDARYALYKQINAALLDFLPGVPIVHAPPSLVVASNVEGLVASPLSDERFQPVHFTS